VGYVNVWRDGSFVLIIYLQICANFVSFACMQKFVFKPYYLKREKQKALENVEKTSAKV